MAGAGLSRDALRFGKAVGAAGQVKGIEQARHLTQEGDTSGNEQETERQELYAEHRQEPYHTGQNQRHPERKIATSYPPRV